MIPFLVGIVIGLGIIVYVSNNPSKNLNKSEFDEAVSQQVKKSQTQQESLKSRAQEKFRRKLEDLERENSETSERERIEAAIAELESEEQRAVIGSLKQNPKESKKLTKKEMQEMQHNYRAKEFGKTVCFTFLELLIVSSVFIFVAHQFIGVGTLESKVARWINGM